MKKILVLVALALGLFTNMGVFAQADNDVTYSKYLAACLYSFSRYVNWPIDKKNGDFMITVVGNKDVYNDLQQMTSGRMVGSQPIVVKFSKTANEVSNINHIVFLSVSQSNFAPKLETNGTLLVAEREGSVQKGASVDFVNVDDVIKFEISKTNMTKQGLQLSSFLEKLSYRVM